MKRIKLNLRGIDQYGNSRAEVIEVFKYNLAERIYRAAKFGLVRILGPRISYRLGISKSRFITKISIT